VEVVLEAVVNGRSGGKFLKENSLSLEGGGLGKIRDYKGKPEKLGGNPSPPHEPKRGRSKKK